MIETSKTAGDAEKASILSNATKSDDGEDWLVGFREKKPLPPVLWGWAMMAILLAVQTKMVADYTEESTALKVAGMPIWATYVLIQLVCIAYSWIVCSYLLPLVPTIFGIPFFLIFFGPALVIW